MGSLIAEIFSKTDTVESFSKSIVSLEGAFPFDSPSMIELGTVYFTKYPDRFSNRNREEVMIGYAIVRVCVVEKIVKDMDESKKGLYRAMLADVKNIEESVGKLIKLFGRDSLLEDYQHIASELQKIKNTIDEIPKGMIKERFVGGITNLFNILYVLKMTIAKMTA